MPFGQGDVPIVESLQLMKKNQWKFQATIEFEYPVPEGSDLLTEMGKCVEYCKKALLRGLRRLACGRLCVPPPAC